VTTSDKPATAQDDLSRRLWIPVLVTLGIALSIFLCRLSLTAGLLMPGITEPTPFVWSVGEMLPRAGLGLETAVEPGFYCNSCGGSCREDCLDGGVAVGMHTRFLWCQVMSGPGSYNVNPVIDWVEGNAEAGLRSVIGFNPKTDRGVLGSSRGCPSSSDGSPPFMLQPGSKYDPLVNGTGADVRYHLNYADPDVQAEFRGFLQTLHQAFLALPADVLATVDSIELDIGHDGEMDAARNYDDYPAGRPLGWLDADMYKCVYQGFTWEPAINQQSCWDGDQVLDPGKITDRGRFSGASRVWRDDVIKQYIDIYGQELSLRSKGLPAGKPVTLMVAGQLINAGERASICQDCDGLNVIDYAWESYGIGAKTSGVNPDFGSGNGPDDRAGQEYQNWPNIFKMNWTERLGTGGTWHCRSGQRQGLLLRCACRAVLGRAERAGQAHGAIAFP